MQGRGPGLCHRGNWEHDLDTVGLADTTVWTARFPTTQLDELFDVPYTAKPHFLSEHTIASENHEPHLCTVVPTGNTDSSGQQGETRKEMEMERESATNMLRKSNEDPEMISKLSLNLRSKKGSTLPTFALKVQKETKGSNNASFRRHCEAMVKMHKPVMLVLLETRMGEHKRLIEVLNFESLILPAAVGLCRGIVIMWKKDILKLNDISITMLSIHVMFQVTTDDTNPWLFYAIYASNDFAIRNNLWKELTDLSKNTSSEWLSRGIRQGHHMSPYLFIICMERLSRDINRKVDNKSWYPIKTTNSGPKISHLFFVVDPTLFARANILNCNAIT
ncbi:hypothetical protein KY285_035862 [Solanum tuberosum]|nr:hypothetical protein KY285_035862 [Solanum tuberosum]